MYTFSVVGIVRYFMEITLALIHWQLTKFSLVEFLNHILSNLKYDTLKLSSIFLYDHGQCRLTWSQKRMDASFLPGMMLN